jgi:hypothetical protein
MARERGLEVVARALERYAARGVFRRFSVRPERGGRRRFRFTWLTPRPMSVTYEPASGQLAFRNLLPGVGKYPGLVAGLRRVLDEYRDPAAPAHRRIDARRARLTSSTRGGSFSMALQIRDGHSEYAVCRGLNLVNELFLLLQANYPEYLVECFGFRSE